MYNPLFVGNNIIIKQKTTRKNEENIMSNSCSKEIARLKFLLAILNGNNSICVKNEGK